MIGTIGAAAVAFGAASSLHGSGFLAVYLAGLMLGTVPIPAKRAVTVFHEGLALVAQVTMFVVLGLLVFPSQLGDVALEGTLWRWCSSWSPVRSRHSPAPPSPGSRHANSP